MRKYEILEEIYGLNDPDIVFKLLTDEINKIFRFDCSVFYQLKSQDRLSALFLKLPEVYNPLVSVYKKSLEVKLKEFITFYECINEKKIIKLDHKQIQKENNAIKRRMQYFELEENVEEVILFPILKPDKTQLGIFLFNTFSKKIPHKVIEKINIIIQLFSPVIYNSILIKDLLEKQINIEKITGKYQKVFNFIIEFNKLLRIEDFFSYLTREMNKIFGFEIGFIHLENSGKLPICYGSATTEKYLQILDELKDYFSLEKNAPLLYGEQGPEMASCLLFINNSHYYIEDAEIFYKREIKLLPKDKIALFQIIKIPLKSIIHHPIRDNDKPIGMLQMWTFSDVAKLTENDIEMISFICSFIPSVLKNNSLHSEVEQKRKEVESKNKIIQFKNSQFKEELKLAKTIQQELIPLSPPKIEGISLACLYKPMEDVGGDFFDFIKVREPNLLGIFISDVSGHGVPAALITSMVKTLVETSGEYKLKPARLLKYINENLSGKTAGNFLTCFYGLYNADLRILTYSKAAHNPPYLIRENKLISLEAKGQLLGLFDDLEFEEKEIKLKSGDKVIFYTDGLVEAINSKNIEFEKFMPEVLLKNAIMGSQKFLEALYHELLHHREEYIFDDDVCIVVMDVD